MKLTYYVLAFMFILNAVTLVLQGIGIVGVPMTPYNPDQWEDTFDSDEMVSAWEWGDSDFHDVGTGLGFFWNMNFPIVESFVGTLQNYGAPSLIVQMLRGIWRFFWGGFVVSILIGRDFMP